MSSSRKTRRRCLCACLALAAGAQLTGRAAAQTTLTNTVTIPLSVHAYSKDDSVYYKYGIAIGLGGGSPQVFEFDTGGSGFFAAYATNAAWWGSAVSTPQGAVANSYGSGLAYEGVQVQTSLAFYAPGTSSPPLLVTGTNVYVAQSTNITRNGTAEWLMEVGTPPVEENFYGDFGLSLAAKEGSVFNVFSQLSYANGVKGAFIVSLGPYGSTNAASVQVGATQQDLDSFTLFAMRGKDTNGPFTSYSPELIEALVVLQDGTVVATNLPVNLDTGTPTPTFHDDEHDGYLPSEFLDGDQIRAGVELRLAPTNAPSSPFYLLTAGDDYGVDLLDVKFHHGPNGYLNLGAPIFQRYDVLFDFENGYVGLRPGAVPETRQAVLMLAGLAGLWLYGVLRSRLPGKRSSR